MTKPRDLTSAPGLGIEAVVLCGGLGTRLASAVPDHPKALAPIAGRPFLEWQLSALSLLGIRRAVLATGHRADAIRRAIGDGSHVGLTIVHSAEPRPLGTGGALRYALEVVPAPLWLVVNGDSWCDIELQRLRAVHRRLAARVTMQLTTVLDRSRYGAVMCDRQGWVTSLAEKSHRGPGTISAGAYLIARDVISALPAEQPLSLETDVLPSLVGNGLAALTGAGRFVDIGTPESYRRASTIIAAKADA